MSVAEVPRRAWAERRSLVRALEPVALVLLLVVLPLESVLVISTAVLIPPYIVVLPLLGIVALVAAKTPREFLPGRPLTLALLAWIAVMTASLAMWVVHRPPSVGLAAGYGSLRGSLLRGPIQLAITLAFLAALPLVLVLARRRLGLAVACFVGVAAAVALYGIYQVIANRLGLPLRNISNDPLVAGRSFPTWRGLVRSYSTFGEPSPFAAYLLGPLAIAVALAVWPPRPRARRAAIAAAAVIFVAFVYTFSTGAWLALPVLAVVLLAAGVHRRAWSGIALVSLAAVALVFVALLPSLATNGEPEPTRPSPAPASHRSVSHATASGRVARAPARIYHRLRDSVDKERTGPRFEIELRQFQLWRQRHMYKAGERAAAPPAPEATASGGIMSVPATIFHRIRDSIDSGRSGPRFEIERYQIHLWKAYPVLGVGIGAADLYTARMLDQTSLPSTYGVWFGLLSETGTAGMLAFLLVVGAFVVGSVRTLRLAPRSPWYPVVAGALAGVIAELAAYVWFYERIPPHVWALMGLGVLASWRARAETAR